MHSTTGSNLRLQTHHHHTGHQTSIDLLKQRSYTTNSAIGRKRSLDDPTDPNATRQNALPSLSHQREPTCSTKTDQLSASKITRVRDEPTVRDAAQRSAFRLNSTPAVSQNPRLSLSFPQYGLPPRLVSNLRSLGIQSIYSWQASCLLHKSLLNGERNLVYTAPTGGGKSLVADVLMLKRVLDSPARRALLVLPYVALVQEKTKWLRRAVEGVRRLTALSEFTQCQALSQNSSSTDLRVASFFGGNRSQMAWSDSDIAVCTIEMANVIVNTAIEEGRSDELGVVVVDELHMLDDEYRGYILELMITKLLTLQNRIQIIGMSATVSNPELLANWFQAKFFVSKYRPIPIEEHLVYKNHVYSTSDTESFFKTASQLSVTSTQLPSSPTHEIAESVHKELKNPILNSVVALAVETAVTGYGALVFCSSRQGTQSLATLVSNAISIMPVSDETRSQRADIMASLQALTGGYEHAFSKTIPAGVGFHHAGLTVEEREIVAEAYDAGFLKIMIATCTLAAGINLPARRVIVQGARMGRQLIGPAMLRQMRGRAGRKGKDEIGETFLCCQKDELGAVAELLEAELPPVVSCLTPDKRGLKRAVLEVIAIRLASSLDSLRDYLQRSLLWQTTNHNTTLAMLDSALNSLVSDELIAASTDNVYLPTRLGSAIVASGFAPDDGLFIHNELRRALSSFVMDTELHMFYLFTPLPHIDATNPITSDISWPVFRTLLDTLDEAALRALSIIGISPALVNRMAQSGQADLKENTPAEVNRARIYRRAYTTFALRDICNETPIHTISLKYGLPRGQIQNLAQSCHGFAAGMIKFCQRMSLPGASTQATSTSGPSVLFDPQSAGFSMLSAVLTHMQDRLRAGARADLLEMAQVTFVKGRMARLLWESGFKGVRALAEADPRKDILPVMMQVSGWKLRPRPSTNGVDVGGNANGSHAEPEEDWAERSRRLEEKLLGKAEVLVNSAARVWESMCLKHAIDEE